MSPVLSTAQRSLRPDALVATSRKTAPATTRSRGKQVRIAGAKRIVNALLPTFSRQLAAMLSAGMPIVNSLETMEEQTDHPTFRNIIQQVRRTIENGSSLSESMRQFPSIFGDLYCNMVRGGETSGQLSETIARLATLLEDSAKLRRKIKSAMMYPTIVLCIAVAIAVGMIIFIVPVFGSLYADFGAQLPGPTLFLMNLSDHLKNYGPYMLGTLVVLVVAFKKFKATPKGAYTMDQVALKLPVFGELNRLVISSRFARTLGQMIRSGVPILNALEICCGAVANAVAAKVVQDARAGVENGEPLAASMLGQKVFPIILVRMIQAGEKTGKVEEMMDNIADFYDDEIDTMVAGLTSLLEPMMIVILGILIGGIVLCMFLPIFKMGEIVGG